MLGGVAFDVPQKTLSPLGLNLILFQGFNLTDVVTWNGPSWSIGAEFVFAIAVLVAGKRVGWSMANSLRRNNSISSPVPNAILWEGGK